jgi:hypothetical protein
MKHIVSVALPISFASVITLISMSVFADNEIATHVPIISGDITTIQNDMTTAYSTSDLESAEEYTYREASEIGSGEDDVISAFGGHRDDFLR